MKNWRYALIACCLFQSASLFAWNGLGHRLIAQIAYNHLTPHAKRTFNYYNRALDKVYKPQKLVNAAAWLDYFRYQDVSWFNSMHYIDIAFSEDGSPLPPLAGINAVWAIDQAQQTLLSRRATDFDKGFALRILLHVTGDVHQPLHAATRISARFPQGDRGGNQLMLGKNAVAANLHGYWDRGAGLLVGYHPYAELNKMAAEFEKAWPCNPLEMNKNAGHWAQESHQLALTVAYKIKDKEIPDTQYQQRAQDVVSKRIALAGCRLAAVLNQIDETLVQQSTQKKSRYPSTRARTRSSIK